MSLPILYSFRRCPYAMRARAALIASGIQVELREVDLRNKPAAMLAVSPKGSVPVLVLPDGKVLDESWDIMLWALQQHDPQSWLGKDGRHIPATLPLVNENDTTFKQNLDRYKYPERYPEQPQSAYRGAGETFLQRLEQLLSSVRPERIEWQTKIKPVQAEPDETTRHSTQPASGQIAGYVEATRINTTPCLLGESFSIADAALLPFVRQFAAVDTVWFAAAPYPALRAWLERYTTSELFGLVMRRFPVWIVR